MTVPSKQLKVTRPTHPIWAELIPTEQAALWSAELHWLCPVSWHYRTQPKQLQFLQTDSRTLGPSQLPRDVVSMEAMAVSRVPNLLMNSGPPVASS